MDLAAIEYSSRPMTLAHRIWLRRIQNNGDPEATLELFVARTNLTPTEAGNLEDEEVTAVLEKVCSGIVASSVLQNLAKGLENAENKS